MARGRARGAPRRQRHLDLMPDRAPKTDGGEPETSSEAMLDELVRALARQIAKRDYERFRYKPRIERRRNGGEKDSG